MSLPAFIKDNDQLIEKKEKKKKGNFNEKCLEVLRNIKKLDKGKHSELNKTYQSQYCGHNVQKKKIIGFYGQLVHEFKLLEERDKKGPPPAKAPVQMASTSVKKTKKKTPVPAKSPQKKKAKMQTKKKITKTKKKVKKSKVKKTAGKSKKTVKKKKVSKGKKTAKRKKGR